VNREPCIAFGKPSATEGAGAHEIRNVLEFRNFRSSTWFSVHVSRFSRKSSIWNVSPLFPKFAPEIDVRRERRPFPSSFITPQRTRQNLAKEKRPVMEPLVAQIEGRIQRLLAEDPDLFLVEIRVKPTNNIKVFIDGDKGVSIERLVQYNRNLYRQIEESAMFPNGDFSLELSSPGLDEPLKLHRQYIKNIGRYVEVMDKEGLRTEGKLLSATDTEIIVEEEKGKNKKKEFVQHTIPFENIKSTKIQIKI
jgi:ribosome maturation factor RimP